MRRHVTFQIWLAALAVALGAVMGAGCGGTDCEKITCPVGTSPKGSKTITGGAEGDAVKGRAFGEGACEIECVPPRPCCEGEKWTETSYECAKACTEGSEGDSEGSAGEMEGSEGTEGTEGMEGVEGAEGSEGSEGQPEGSEGVEGMEGAEGAEGEEGQEGAEGAESDAGVPPGDPPVITNIDGDGSPLPVNEAGSPTVPELPGEIPGEAVRAGRRFQYAWVVSGENLDGVTAITLREHNGDHIFVIPQEDFEEQTMTRIQFPLPAAGEMVAGLFYVVLTANAGNAEAQAYVLQGEPGKDAAPAGVIEGDVRITGKLTVEGEVLMSVDPDCPAGYTKDAGDSVNGITVCKKGADEMVKAGDFWIDRYEASVWNEADCKTQVTTLTGKIKEHGYWEGSARAFACSVGGVKPSGGINWLQAQQLCAASGKNLPTNAEWQMAASGTTDPGPHPGTETSCGTTTTVSPGKCHTCGSESRATGLAGDFGKPGNCVSTYGAEDMIGNLTEWAGDWMQAGATETTFVPGANTTGGSAGDGWPGQRGGLYSDDYTSNINGSADYRDETGIAEFRKGLPAVPFRGGAYDAEGWSAGAFFYDIDFAPNSSIPVNGFRCVKHR